MSLQHMTQEILKYNMAHFPIILEAARFFLNTMGDKKVSDFIAHHEQVLESLGKDIENLSGEGK